MPLALAAARKKLDRILNGYGRATSSKKASVLPLGLTSGKMYEAWVLCEVLDKLRRLEGYTPMLKAGRKVVLRSSPGPIDPRYSAFHLTKHGAQPLALYTDIEFLTLSHQVGHPRTPPHRGYYHELDIVCVPQSVTNRPTLNEVCLGVECKNTSFEKRHFREVLGVRRELGLLTAPMPTAFGTWPRSAVPSYPPSCLLVYCSQPNVLAFKRMGGVFGIDFYRRRVP